MDIMDGFGVKRVCEIGSCAVKWLESLKLTLLLPVREDPIQKERVLSTSLFFFLDMCPAHTISGGTCLTREPVQHRRLGWTN